MKVERATTNSLVTTPMVVIGEVCNFETSAKRFGIDDRAVRKIAEMIHDADLEDGKFQRNEALGINRILRGWAKLGVSDEEILSRGFQCIDALYVYLE